jgi:small acid-soluble spore protein P (minor)
MSKPKTQPAGASYVRPREDRDEDQRVLGEPLPGSKRVKNRNHSQNNHGEGR